MNFKNATFIVISFLLILWVGGFVWFSVSSLSMKPQKTNKTTDAIVVLTGDNTRIDAGIELFAAGLARHLFITGVHPDVTKGKIVAMWSDDIALPPCCITLGYKATTTFQNAQETREWLINENYSSIRLVTSGYHMHRSLIELRHALPGIEIIPNAVANPELSPWQKRFWDIIPEEFHKTLLRKTALLFASPVPFPEDNIK